MQIRATISGSFHRHMSEIAKSLEAFRKLRVEVLSPRSADIISYKQGDFLFIEGDPRSPKIAQDRHFAAIKNSDFLWIASNDGYVGNSVAMEIGYASGYKIPIFAKTKIVAEVDGIDIKNYITIVKSEKQAASYFKNKQYERKLPFYLDSQYDQNLINHELEKLERNLVRKVDNI